MNSSYYEGREQSQVKHKFLERYLHAAIPVIGSWAEDIAYIDCCAGPWESRSPSHEDTSFSIAINALLATRATLDSRGKNPTMRALLIERDPQAFEKLSGFGSAVRGIETRTKNWDFSKHTADILSFVRERSDSFSVTFIDPKGWRLAGIPTIRPLLELSPGEVIINLMTSFMGRFLSDRRKNFTKVLGENVETLCDLRGEDREEGLVRCYAEFVKKAGNFGHVCTMPVMKPDQDAFHFYLIYGTRHPKGVEEFRKAEKDVVEYMHSARAKAQQRREVERSQQPFLLTAEETYKESRFTRFQRRSLAAARAAVLTLVRAKQHVLYDDVWLEFMQHSGVVEEDLRNFVLQMENAREIAVDRYGSKKRKLQRKTGVGIRWIGSSHRPALMDR